MKKALQKLSSLMIAFLLFFTSTISSIPFALAADDSINFVQVQVILATDNDGNNFANIGDIIQIQAVLNNTDGGCGAAGTTVTANMTNYGGTAAENLSCVADNAGAGDVFDLGFPIVDAVPGGIDVTANNAASQIQVVASDADENNGAGNPNPTQNTNPLGDGGIDTTASNGVDTQAPVITDGNIISTLSTDINTNNIAEINDIITIVWDNSAGGDNNTDIVPADVFANLSAFGGSATQQLFDDGTNGDTAAADDQYSFDLTISSGSINAANLNASVGAQDDAQNGTSGVSDSSNLSVNNTSGSGRRRNTVQSITDIEESSQLEIESNMDCGCDKEKEALDTISFDIYNSYINNDQLLCVNPGCFESPVVETISPTEEFLINATHERKEASKKLRDAMDKESKARQKVKDSEVNAGNANFDFLKVLHDGFRAGEKRQDYDQRKREAALKRQRAFDDLRNAGRDLENAEQERRKASREFDEAKKKWNDGYQAAKEEFGAEKANEMYRKAEETEVFGASCIDPNCDTGSVEVISQQIAFDTAAEQYNSCLDQCTLEENENFTPWSAADEFFNEEDDDFIEDEAQDKLTDSLEDEDLDELLSSFLVQFENEVSPADLAPFESVSGLESYVPSALFASDISDHPDVAFLLELYHLGAVKGQGDSKEFAPGETMTRAALLKVALEVFGYELPSTVRKKPFKDVDLNQWHAKYFEAGAENNILLGYGDQDLPQEEREAIPWQEVRTIEALAIFTRAAGVDVSSAEDYQSEYVDEANPQWWDNIWKWSEKNGVINTEDLSYQVKNDEGVEGEDTLDHKDTEAATPGYTVVLVYPKDDPDSLIQRHGLALAIKILALKNKEPCNCDTEKAAWDTAEKDAADKQLAANNAETAAQKSETAAKKAESTAKEAQQAVDDLQKFDDESSSATGEDDTTITTGDLRLMELAKAEIDQQVANGDKSLEDGQKEKETINKDKLPELRARRDALMALAREKRDSTDKAAKEARSQANSDKSKAEQAQKEADDAKKAAEDAEKAYEECVKKCKIIKEKVSNERKRLEAERKKRALAAAREKAAAKIKADREAKAEAARQAREDAADKARRDAEIANAETGEAGPIPNASKDPCKEKFLQAVAARGAQIAKTRPDDIPEPPEILEDTINYSTALGDLIAAAAQTAASGGKTAAQVANALAALPQVAYGLWVDYVGDAIKDAGTRIINNRRICNYVKHGTSGKCGYESFPPGQVVYWEKDASGKYKATIMGPGDNISQGVCE